jgi:hypothetical protein
MWLKIALVRWRYLLIYTFLRELKTFLIRNKLKMVLTSWRPVIYWVDSNFYYVN